MAQTHYTAFTVQSGQVPSTQTDFPVLLSPTDDRFKHTGQGAGCHVAGTSGYDLRPYSDAALTTPLTYELVDYDPTTGYFEMWVKVGSLTDSSVIYVGYGDSALSSDGSSTATWSASFMGAWHKGDGSSLSLADSSGNGYTLTNNNAVTAAVGQVGGAGDFEESSSQSLSRASWTTNPVAMSFEAWVRPESLTQDYAGIVSSRAGGANFSLYVRSSGKLAIYTETTGVSGANYDDTGTATLSTATWYHLAATYNASAGLVGYVNASSDGTDGADGNLEAGAPNLYIGWDQINGYFDGRIDEVRISSVARSAHWITTAYNNQNAPGSFYSVGTEQSVGPAPTPFLTGLTASPLRWR